MRKILTMQDLVQFYADNPTLTFASKDRPLIVQSVQDFAETEVEEVDGKLYAYVKVCHTLKNRNGSYISEEDMTRCMPSLKDSPLLGHIHQLDDGTWDFHTHDMQVNEETGEIDYIEQPIGHFTADEPTLMYDKDMDKTYVVAKVVIPETYTKAADIIKRKGGTKVSCELAINDCSYNAKEKYLQLNDFMFLGVTCLGSEKDGTEIGEGMLGSKLSLADFEAQDDILVEIRDKMNLILSRFDNIKNLKEGGNTVKIDELLAKYGKTLEDIEFDYSEMSDEELEAKFAEVFDTPADAEGDPEQAPSDGEPETIPATEAEADPQSEPEVVPESNYSKSFELSHDDIRSALYALLGAYEEADNEWYYIEAVYDDHFAYSGMFGGQIWGHNYTKDGDNVALDGERYALHRELLTDSEYAELQTMRSNYSGLVEYKTNAEKAQLNAERDAVLSDPHYASISGKDADGKYMNAAYGRLVAQKENYSVEDLQKEMKVILADFMVAGGQFSAAPTASEPVKSPMRMIGVPLKDTKARGPYGNIFKK